MITEKKILNSKIGIVAHDSGGANYIKSFLNVNNVSAYCFLDGPATSIFNNSSKYKICNSLDQVISKTDVIMFGTGIESGFEIQALAYSKNKILTVSVLDHWTNYFDRFKLNNKYLLPDSIMVFDKYAYILVNEQIKNFNNLLLVDNYYIKDQIRKSKNLTRSKDYILYIDEPIKLHPNSSTYNYDEVKGFENFLKKIKKSKYKNDKILIRLHPSETNLNKYKLMTKIEKKISVSTQKSLTNDISNSKFVVGYESMAMVVALELRKQVYSIIPNFGIKSKLPHKEIKSFFDEI